MDFLAKKLLKGAYSFHVLTVTGLLEIFVSGGPWAFLPWLKLQWRDYRTGKELVLQSRLSQTVVSMNNIITVVFLFVFFFSVF